MDGQAITTKSDLELMLLDESMEAKALPLSLLKCITDGFSDENKIGSGGFAVVYKGRLNYSEVAVKQLIENRIDEEKFIGEVHCLMKAKHKNIVRFLGYCSDTQGQMVEHKGKSLMADVRQRLLCFEYVPNGTLAEYIKDASREWGKCYKIIKGVCEGLHYLHKERIVHRDLKPANILLDNDMVPKITDFGISRCFDELQTHHFTSKLTGTLGYLAPEVFHNRKITFKSDIYSLGTIITEILTGDNKGRPEVEEVQENWSHKLEGSQKELRLEQIQVCTEVCQSCLEYNPEDRPSAQKIIDILKQTEREECIEPDASSHSPRSLGVLRRDCCTSEAAAAAAATPRRSSVAARNMSQNVGDMSWPVGYMETKAVHSRPPVRRPAQTCTGAGPSANRGVASFEMDYSHWVDEQKRHTAELRSALQGLQTSELELRLLVETWLSHYEHLFRIKAMAANADVFHVISGMWMTPAERFFVLWIGGFRPSKVLKILSPQLEPLTEPQRMLLAGLQHTSAQAEDALSQGMEMLQQNVVDILTAEAHPFGPPGAYMLHMAAAVELEDLVNFDTQADHLRLTMLQQMQKILTTRQAARGFLALGDYFQRFRTQVIS